MSEWPTCNNALDLALAVKRFPIAQLREEIGRRRDKLRSLGWPAEHVFVEEDVACAFETFQRMFADSGSPAAERTP